MYDGTGKTVGASLGATLGGLVGPGEIGVGGGWGHLSGGPYMCQVGVTGVKKAKVRVLLTIESFDMGGNSIGKQDVPCGP